MTTPPRTVPISEVRDYLDTLKEQQSIAGIALATGLTPRSVYRLMTTTGHIYATTATRIAEAAGAPADGPDLDSATTRAAPVTRAVVAEYSRTPEGRVFVAQCRAPRKYRRAA